MTYTVTQATDLANMICECATHEQRKRDVAAIMAAMDACRIETLERAADAAEQHSWDETAETDEDDAWTDGATDTRWRIAAAIRALKGKSNE